MSNELTIQRNHAVAGLGEMRVQDIVDRKRKLVEVMDAVMKDGTHYGKIPGCGDKPTLYKAGAEVVATVFGLAPTFKITQVDLPNNHREYQITCTLTHIGTGASLGEGVGSCSTMESKYRWRAGQRLCPNCGKATIIRGKAEYGGGWLCFDKKGGCGSKWRTGDSAIEGQSIDRAENPDIADQYNTVLKMAKKRAQVDCTLTAVGASDILTQDLEDLPEGSPAPAISRRHADASDAVVVNETSAALTVDEALAAIGAAPTLDDLNALAPSLSPFSGNDNIRQAFKARKKGLAA